MMEIYSGEQITVALAFNGFVISKLRAGAFDCPQNQSRFTLVVGSRSKNWLARQGTNLKAPAPRDGLVLDTADAVYHSLARCLPGGILAKI